MDDDTAELVRLLLTRSGMTLEDGSASALTAADEAFVERLDALARAIDYAGTPLRAALLKVAAARTIGHSPGSTPKATRGSMRRGDQDENAPSIKMRIARGYGGAGRSPEPT